jgi:hypothetical protein
MSYRETLQFRHYLSRHDRFSWSQGLLPRQCRKWRVRFRGENLAPGPGSVWDFKVKCIRRHWKPETVIPFKIIQAIATPLSGSSRKSGRFNSRHCSFSHFNLSTGEEWSSPYPGRYISKGGKTGNHSILGWMVRRAGLGVLENRKSGPVWKDPDLSARVLLVNRK